jgi:hypothetical protein
MMFVQDTKDLVGKAVATAIKRDIRSDDEARQEHGQRRKLALRAWNKCTHPLAWNEDGKGDNRTYALLVTILNQSHADPLQALTEVPTRLGYDQMALRIYNMGKSEDPAAVTAPVNKQGAFPHALPLAIQMIKRRTPSSQDPSVFTAGILEVMLRKMSIQFVPWHKPGPRSHAVQHDIWMVLERRPTRWNNKEGDHNSGGITPQTVATQAAHSNASAPWKLPESLYKMGSLWQKTVLPVDWTLKMAALEEPTVKPGTEYVRDTYIYVQDHYDGSIWWHHMALVWAILFSKVTPFLFPEKGSFIQGRNERELTTAVRKIRWIEGSSKFHKGVTASGPYIPMLSTTIIALLDKNSPLSQYISSNNNSFGKAWTDKHGMQN